MNKNINSKHFFPFPNRCVHEKWNPIDRLSTARVKNPDFKQKASAYDINRNYFMIT